MKFLKFVQGTPSTSLPHIYALPSWPCCVSFPVISPLPEQGLRCIRWPKGSQAPAPSANPTASRRKRVHFGLLIQTIHVSRGVVSPQLGSKASDEAKLQSFRWGARGRKELPRQLLQPNDYPCWWEKNRHYCTLSTPLNLHLTPLKPVTAGAYGTSPFHSRHRKLWYPGAMGSTELPAPYVPYTNSNLCPPQAGSPRHHQTPLNIVDGFVGQGWFVDQVSHVSI